MVPLILMTFGEWIELNIVGIVIAIVGWLLSAGAALWYMSGMAADLKAQSKANGDKVESLAAAFERHRDDMENHTKDPNVHTTFEQRQAINARFDRIEQSMEVGHNRIENKIDRWAERLLAK